MAGALKIDLTNMMRDGDELIRSGKVSAARDLLEANISKSIPRSQAANVAHLCFRAGLFSQALKILVPYVRPESKILDPATPLESATYAASLIKIGSVEEALEILGNVRERIPQVSLYTAFAHQAQWDYKAALPHLRSYVEAKDISDYERAVGEVNLLAALIVTADYASAEALGNEILERARVNRWTLLYKNVQELSAQIAFGSQNYSEAKSRLEHAARERYRDESVWDFFLRKWLAYVELMKLGPTQPTLEGIRAIRQEAVKLNHWETVRECDYHLACATQDERLFLKVWFGTPFDAYRARIHHEAKSWVSIPDAYVYCPHPGPTPRVMDLFSGSERGRETTLKPGQVMHLGLQALASDFYRPLYIGQMHARIFPNEYYNPTTSPDRVMNVIKRLRNWMKENEIPLQIHIENSFYQLKSDGPYGLEVRRAKRAQAHETLGFDVQLERLRSVRADQLFTSQEAAETLGLSKSSVVTFLNWAVSSGRIEKSGVNRNTKYKVVK